SSSMATAVIGLPPSGGVGGDTATAVLAVGFERGAGLAVEGGQGHACSAGLVQGAAGTAAVPCSHPVADRGQLPQPLRVFRHEVDLLLPADFADGGLAVGVCVEVGDAGVAPGVGGVAFHDLAGLAGQDLAGAVVGGRDVGVLERRDAVAGG